MSLYFGDLTEGFREDALSYLNLLCNQNYRDETNLAKCEQLESPGGGHTVGFILKTMADPPTPPPGYCHWTRGSSCSRAQTGPAR